MHKVASCTSGNCRKCNKKHHTAICSEIRLTQPQKGLDTKKSSGNQTKSTLKPYSPSKQHVITKIGTAEQDTPITRIQIATENTEPETTVLQVKKKNDWTKGRVILLTGAIQVFDIEGNKRKAVVLLDTGSELSFIEERLANELKLPTLGTASLQLSTFRSASPKIKTCAITSLKMLNKKGAQHEVRLYKNDYITSTVQRATLDHEDLHFIKKGNYELSLPTKGGELQPQILLGCDYLWNLMKPSTNLSLPSGLQLIPTKLGYIISGRQEDTDQKLTVSCTLQEYETEKETWDRYSSLESTGTGEYNGSQQTELQKINERVLESFKESIERRKDGYYVRLPWKENRPELPDNKALALKRLERILDMYQSDTDTLRT